MKGSKERYNMGFEMVSLMRPANGSSVKEFGYESAKKAIAFHRSFPDYKVTPLAHLSCLAKELNLSDIYVKDESYRFGLNAFKVLGGSYAIGNYIAKRLNVDISELTYDKIIAPETKKVLGDITFITATDGNHGRGIAWTANRIGQKCVVYMPKGSAKERLENIRALGADASITDLKYDDAVRKAKEDGDKNGWFFVQDTAWEGYTEIPKWIMQGYTTLVYEAFEQLNDARPTHIFLQAGVGALSGAAAGFFADVYGDNIDQWGEKGKAPVVTIVETEKADCIYRTASANDGKLHFAEGDMHTIMAGLACGEPCTIGWEILHDHADFFVRVPEWTAADGMRVLGNPLGDDARVISGESGAATLGFVADVMRRPELADLKERLHLDEQSRVLCISTEGDTDRENYLRIVWNGAFAK